MNKSIKIVVLATAVVLLAWLLPWFYHFALSDSERTPFTMYSCVVGKFVYVEATDKGLIYKDVDGGIYTESQYDSILPFFYYRQLTTDGRLPDTIAGVAVTPQVIGRENFIYRHSPQDINVRKPKLYPLLESRSGRVDLTMPDDVFRLGKKIEFIDMAANAVDVEKSERFDRVMREKGFAFPAVDLSGNPTARKEYDEGYLLLDAGGRVFHLKMVAGRPFFRDTGIPVELGMKNVFITEFSSRKSYGFLTDGDNNFYVLLAPSYELVKLPFGFDPTRQSIMILGDMLHWTVRISDKEGMTIYAVDANDFSLVDSYVYPESVDKWEVAGRYIFPFELSFSSYTDKYIQPRLHAFSAWALPLNLLLALVFLGIRRKEVKGNLGNAALIALFGLFLFIPLLLMGRQ